MHSFQNGRYEIMSQLGEGGIAQVWRVLDGKFAIERAIKIVARPNTEPLSDSISHLPQSNTEKRFMREAQLLMHLNHPNIVTVYDFFEENNQLHIVMEKCAGSLSSWIELNGKMPIKLAVQVTIEILKGLSNAHSRNIVHRDIKPHNILIAEDGGIKIADFGLALNSFASETLTKTNALLGSVQFMSPEQRQDPKSIDHRSDIYSTAVTLVWLLEERCIGDLYLSENIDIIRNAYPTPLIDIIQKAGQLRPHQRYSTTKEMIADLDSLMPTLPEYEASLLNVLIQETQLPHSALQEVSTQTPSSVESDVPKLLRYTLVSIVILLITILTMIANVFYRAEKTSTDQVSTTTRFSYPNCEVPLTHGQEYRRKGAEESKGATLFDIDQDGYMDAAFSHALGNEVAIYWGNPQFSFQDPSIVPIKHTSSDPLFGDMDNDGIVDMVILNFNSNQISIHKGLGNRMFRGIQEPDRDIMIQSPSAREGRLLDINADGALDLLFRNNRELFYRLNAQKGLDYSIEHLPNVEEEPLRWHQTIKVYKTAVHISQNQPIVYWFENNLFFRQRIDSSLRIQEKESLFDSQESLKIIQVQTLDNGKDQGLFLHRNGNLIRWDEGKSPCILWKGIDHGDFRFISNMSDWNQDGILDFLRAESCWYCTSNHVLILGEEDPTQ